MASRFSRRTKLILLGIGTAAVAGVALLTITHHCVGPSCRTISADAVKYDATAVIPRRLVKGAFHVETALFGGIASDGIGGACLVADLNPVGLPSRPPGQSGYCTSNASCQGSLPDGWAGYCDKGKGTCWVRPGLGDDRSLCEKSPFYGNPPKQWQPGVVNASNIKGYDLQRLREKLPTQRQVRMRVVACLNGKFTPAPGVDPPCGQLEHENRRELLGPIATFNMPAAGSTVPQIDPLQPLPDPHPKGPEQPVG